MVGEDSPYPLVVTGVSGAVEQANEAARSLFHDGPAWLAEAQRGLSARLTTGREGLACAPVRGPIGERVFEAHPVWADGGYVTWLLIDVTGQQQVMETLRAERDSAVSMVQAATELLSTLNLDRCLETTARLAVRHLARSALVVIPLGSRRYELASCTSEGEPGRESVDLDPRTIPGLDEALQGFPPVPVRWIDPALVPVRVLRSRRRGIRSAAVISLPGHGMPVGALVLLRRSAQFSPHEEMFARLFAARAGTAISIARLYSGQAAITELLMAGLLPPVIPQLDGVEVAARYRAAGGSSRVGGDFYDVYPAVGSGRNSLVVLGDVSGKGLEAAVLTGKIRDTLRALLPMADDHQQVLERLNDVLLAGESLRYVTLVLAGVERRGTRVALRLTSAGHPPPMIVRDDGRVDVTTAHGTAIGLLDEVASTTETVLLRPGEKCLLYSDGVIEARGGPLGDEWFGDERLCEELRRSVGVPTDALAERVQMLALQWAGDREHDDIAIVAIGAPGKAPPAATGGPGL